MSFEIEKDLHMTRYKTARENYRDVTDKLFFQVFDVDFNDVPEIWIAGEIFRTYYENSLSFILPEGEYFMVNTMRELLPKITDEQLKEEMMIFIEEEENHAIVTTRYYQMLQNHGYDVNKQKQAAHDFFKKLNRKTPEER